MDACERRDFSNGGQRSIHVGTRTAARVVADGRGSRPHGNMRCIPPRFSRSGVTMLVLAPALSERGIDVVRHQLAAMALLLTMAAVPATASGQGRPDPAATIAAQREAMATLTFMDGVWRGTAWTILPSGEKHTITQTERVGPFLDGSVKVIEGRGYDPDGTVTFNAFGTVSFNPATHAYALHSYAQGNVGDFVMTPAADGYVWDIPAGPSTIRYTAVIKAGAWREVGDRITPGKDPVRFFEMNLERLGATDWPAAGAVAAK